MSARALLAAAVVVALAGCGGDQQPEVRLLAPAGVVGDADVTGFEQATDCRVDLRVYDASEDFGAIAERRDTDVLARPTGEDETPDVTEQMVRATLRDGIVVTVPRPLAVALDPATIEPAGRRDLTWIIREQGDNDDCARRWVAYATSQ